MISSSSIRLQVTPHRLIPERVRDIPPAEVSGTEAGDGMNLADAEVRQPLRADRGQGIETRVQHPVSPSARGKDEIRPERCTHEAGEEPPAAIFPLVSLHRVSEGYAIAISPKTDGS
ncbi:hypothetical protein GMD70_12680 [Parabacteroides merdae]|nr:hypothetical protein [Parabacteroides merdae]